MSASAATGGARLLASGSGVAIYEDGPRLLVVDRRSGPWFTVAFVLGLLATILGTNGVAQIVIALTGDGQLLELGLGLLLVGVVAAVALVAVVRRIRRSRAETDLPEHTVATFDLGTRQLRDRSGQPVASLVEVDIRRRMQLGSSSPKLVAEWRGGSLILARGNPFAGGIGPLEDVLRERGLMR